MPFSFSPTFSHQFPLHFLFTILFSISTFSQWFLTPIFLHFLTPLFSHSLFTFSLPSFSTFSVTCLFSLYTFSLHFHSRHSHSMFSIYFSLHFLFTFTLVLCTFYLHFVTPLSLCSLCMFSLHFFSTLSLPSLTSFYFTYSLFSLITFTLYLSLSAFP